MTTYQDEQLASNELVVKEAEDHPQSMNLIPSFAKGIITLKGYNAQIESLRPSQEKDNSGVTVSKNYTKDNLIHDTLNIMGAVHSYAFGKNDQKLMGTVGYNTSDVTSTSASKLISIAKIVLTEAKKIPAADLAEEGISAAEITEFENRVASFDKVKSSPREATIERSSDTAEIARLLGLSGDLFDHSLDRLAIQFIEKDPEFYKIYISARNSIHRGGANGTSTGTTKNEATK